MPPHANRLARLSALTLLLLSLSAISQAQYAYDIVSLGSADVYGLNNKGQVAATIPVLENGTTLIYHAAYYEKGVFRDVAPYRGSSTIGSAINDAGMMAIEGNNPSIYNVSTGNLRYLFLSPSALMTGINAAGDVAASAQGSSYIYHYNTNQVEQLYSTTDVTLHSINNSDVVVGHMAQRATYYSNGAFHDIGTLPGGGISDANDINDNGDIVGQSYLNVNGSFPQHAFLYRNGSLQDLGTLVTNTSSAAYGINAVGDIVGNSGNRPFLYRNGQMQDLFTMIDPSLGYTGGSAIAINDNGWVLGNSNRGAFLLMPNLTISGTVALDGMSDAGNLSEAFTFTLTPKAGGTPIVQTQVLSTGGAFSLSHVLFGDYTLSVKGSKWLSASQPVSLTTMSVSGLRFALRGGDANGDNKVDVGDFGVLVNAYSGDVNVPGSGYDIRADFNDDGVVDIGDFGVLVNSYGSSGQ